MYNQQKSSELEDISLEIFGENTDQTIEWQISQNSTDTTTFNEDPNAEFISKVNELKSQLDIILQNTSKEIQVPQCSLINGFFNIELDCFLSKVKEYNSQINQSINLQQNINMIGDTNIVGEPILISIPLN